MNIIAYGSLLNKQSLETTLQRKTKLNKIIIPRYERIFNAPFGEYSFLNLQKNKTSFIETAYFVLKENEIEKFKEREAGSDLVEVLPTYFAFIWPEQYCNTLPVLQSYIDVWAKGAEQLKIDIWKNTIKPVVIEDDRKNPRYK